MIINVETLKEKYQNYNNIFEKIKVEEKNHRLYKIKRSLYTDNKYEEPFIIANCLYNPSYISFETALSFYNMIPERVVLTMSATYGKNKIKEYQTSFGNFYYQDINKKAYPFGIDTMTIDGVIVFIASREKALLDTLSVRCPLKNEKDVVEYIFDDLRLNDLIFDEMDKDKMIELSKLYSAKNCIIFGKYLEKLKRNNNI